MDKKEILDSIVKSLKESKGDGSSAFVPVTYPKGCEGYDVLVNAKSRLRLSKEGFVATFNDDGVVVSCLGLPSDSESSDKPVTVNSNEETSDSLGYASASHEYKAPKVSNEIIDILTDDASHVVWLTGPTQCGKTSLVKHVGGELGRKVFKINCRGDMGNEAFFGDRTVSIDEDTGQNHVEYVKGTVEQAMVEGLNEDGEEVGSPAILFIDEIASLPAHISIGLNGLFESDDPCRSIKLDLDGGRVVKSHSGFRIIVASNVAGRGASTMADTMYAAQMDAQDISLIHRVSACIRMGYDRLVEKKILQEKLGDDRAVSELLNFRDAVRDCIRSGRITSPFSTGNLIKIADLYRIFGDMGKAIYYSTFEFLLPEEKVVYNEAYRALGGGDLMSRFVDDSIDYM